MPDTMGPRQGGVTLVVVAYNHSKYVEQCLDSAFEQTHLDFRVVIFDDASPDDTVDVVRGYLHRTGHEDVTFIAHEQNRGLCATLNEARDLVDTEYIAFISADDWMEPERFALQVAELQRLGPRYGLLYGDAYRADVDGFGLGYTYFEQYRATINPAYEPPSGDIFLRELAEPANPTPTVLFRTGALDGTGPYDERLRFEDTDMLLRIAKTWLVGYLDQPLVTYRATPGSLLGVLYKDLGRFLKEQELMLGKHLGASREADRIIAYRLGAYAKAAYLAGEPAAAVASDLVLAFRHARTPANITYVALSRIGVPGRRLARAVGVVRSLKLRVRAPRTASRVNAR